MVANKFLNAPITERDTRGTSTQVIFFALWIFFSLLFGMRFRSVFFLNWRLLSYSREHLLRIPNKHQVNAKRSKKHATEPLVLRERKREKNRAFIVYCILNWAKLNATIESTNKMLHLKMHLYTIDYFWVVWQID